FSSFYFLDILHTTFNLSEDSNSKASIVYKIILLMLILGGYIFGYISAKRNISTFRMIKNYGVGIIVLNLLLVNALLILAIYNSVRSYSHSINFVYYSIIIFGLNIIIVTTIL